MGFSALVVLHTSVNSIIMFLMWMLVQYSRLVQLACLGLNSVFYTIYGELFFEFDLFYFVVLYYRTSRQGSNS